MFRPRPGSTVVIDVPTTTRGLLWGVLVADVATVVWMTRTGTWLDEAGPVVSVVTLGGHSRVVAGLALVGLVLLAVLAPLTGGFARANAVHRVLLPVAGVVSLSALAGLLSLVALAAGLLAVAVLLFRPRQRTRVELTRRRW